MLSLILQNCHCHRDYPLGTYSVLPGYCYKKTTPYLKNVLYLESKKKLLGKRVLKGGQIPVLEVLAEVHIKTLI